MKIDFGKSVAPTKNTFAKQGSRNTATNRASENSAAADHAGNSENEGVSSNDFASVLEGLSSKSKNPEPKKNDSSKINERSRSNDDKTHEKHRAHEESAKEDLKDRSNNKAGTGEGTAAAAAANARALSKELSVAEVETSLPPARAMLHIADLERIVSSVRVNQFEGQNQVVVTLKNSVFKGLQIKLTTDENRRVTAEFIAANEQVKNQIDQRSGELTELLKRRGVQVTSLQTTVDTGASGDNRNSQHSPTFESPTVNTFVKASNVDDEIEPEIETNDKSGHIYRV